MTRLDVVVDVASCFVEKCREVREDIMLYAGTCLGAVVAFKLMLWLSPYPDWLLLGGWIAACSWIHGLLAFHD